MLQIRETAEMYSVHVHTIHTDEAINGPDWPFCSHIAIWNGPDIR